MHEYHLVEKIIRGALTGDQEKPILEIFLCVNESSSLDPDSIKLYFDDITRQDACLKDARLSIRLTKAKLHCPRCNLDFERINKSFSCPQCSEPAGRCPSDKEMYIEKVVFKS